jgi:hypothetical protein
MTYEELRQAYSDLDVAVAQASPETLDWRELAFLYQETWDASTNGYKDAEIALLKKIPLWHALA